MLITKPYRRERAVEYAKRWALDRNPLFIDFTGIGGNCTNFVSQSVLAGSCTMNYTKDFGWYYISEEDRAPAWSSVEYFYDFMTGAPVFASQNGGVGPFAREVAREEAELGDVIQYANSMGDWYHTVMITGFDGDEILVSAQSDDAIDRPLSSYRNAVMQRFLHIEGVRIEIDDDVCFETLLVGGEEGTDDGDAPM
ncbi:MAG: amidase domain-containing protein [Clostridia bacterium]|nr:amidase domain-containing protein [Clostridia bacterium]